MYVKRCKQIRLLNLIVWVGLIHFIACDDSKSNKYNQDTGNEEGGGETVGGAEAGNQTSAGDEQLAGEMIAGEIQAGESQAGESQAGETQAGEAMSGSRSEQICPQSIVVDCNFGRQQVDTAQGNADINQYTCAEGFNFPGQELFFEFLEAEAQEVQLRVRQLYTQFAVNYIFFALEGQTDSCEPEQAQCYAQDTLVNDLIILDYVPNKPMWFSIDPRINATETAIFELEISCINSRCGDGIIDERESCDDGNLDAGDGCDNECQTEVNYICSGTPSVCVLDAGNNDCEEVITATSGTYMGDTRGCVSDYAAISGGCGNQSSVSGPDQSYVIDVPANKVLRASIDTVQESGFNAPKLWLAVDTEQAADTCVQQSSEELFWLNGGESEQQIILTVDGVSINDQGVYRLNVDFLDPPSRLGSSCAQAIEVGSGIYMGDTSGDGLPSNLHGGVGGECIRTGGFWGYNGGPDETYKVTLQANQTLNAVANQIGNWDHVLSIHDSCGDIERSCLQWDNYGRGSVTNETEQAQDYYIMVGGFYNYSSGEYTLDITIE